MSLNVRQGLYTALTGSSAVSAFVSTRIYHETAPSNATYPLVIIEKSSGTKRRAFSEPNAFNRETWMVKAVDRNTTSNTVDGAAAAIDTLLDGGTITVTGKKLADLTHIGDIEYLEPDGDQQYRHSGATYRITVTAS